MTEGLNLPNLILRMLGESNMSTHEYWQFAFVREVGDGTRAVPRLGFNSPLKVEHSNLPVGTKPFDTQPLTNVLGDHIRVLYSLPSDLDGYVLTGKLRILKKAKEFPRGYADSTAILVVEQDLSGNLQDRDNYTFFLDHEVTDAKKIWYYTVFYEATVENQNIWVFSPINGHDRAFALSSNLSAFGQQMFDYFPRGIKIKDKSEANDTLYRLCQILGNPLDEIKDRLDQFSSKRYTVENVDASLIPYIDHMLGWPTNFELTELRRRNETVNALDIWKAKGTNNAFELALQELTGWNVELHEGYNHVVTTAMPEDFLDPLTPPQGWDELVDGVWADQVNSLPFNGTPDLSNPNNVYRDNSPENPFRMMFNNNNWLNTFGVLIELTYPINSSPLLSNLARDKIRRLLAYIAIHYANFDIQVADYYQDNLSLSILDSDDDDYLRNIDEAGNLIIVETFSDESNTGVMYTYPHPNSLESATNVIWSSTTLGNVGRLFHNVLN